jgi:hypothetical protein
MPATHLRSSAEHLWNAWLDLNYAAADLAKASKDPKICSAIGSQAAELRSLAEKMENLAASVQTVTQPQRMRRPPES